MVVRKRNVCTLGLSHIVLVDIYIDVRVHKFYRTTSAQHSQI